MENKQIHDIVSSQINRPEVKESVKKISSEFYCLTNVPLEAIDIFTNRLLEIYGYVLVNTLKEYDKSE